MAFYQIPQPVQVVGAAPTVAPRAQAENMTPVAPQTGVASGMDQLAQALVAARRQKELMDKLGVKPLPTNPAPNLAGQIAAGNWDGSGPTGNSTPTPGFS